MRISLKDMLFSREMFSIGLDIGTSSVRIVKLRSADDKHELCAFRKELIPADLLGLLIELKRSYGISRANIGLSGPATVIRYVTFPRMSEQELRQALKFEAQKYLPFSVSEVNYDGYILKDDLPDNKILVALAAVKKDLLNQRLNLLSEAGIRAKFVDADSLSIVNAFNFNVDDGILAKQKAVALVNIGAEVTSLSILENRLPRLSRDIHIAGKHFTQKLMEAFSLDFKSAQELQIAPDAEKAGKVNASLEAVLSSLAAELRTSFDYYESQSASCVTGIFLSGGGSRAIGLSASLANLLGIEAEYWDPFSKINFSDTLDSGKLKGIAQEFPVAVGLALRGK